VCFEPLQYERSWELATYRKIGGYEVWEKILRGEMTKEQVIDEVKASGLRGRGGAGSCRATHPDKNTWYAIPMRANPAPVTIATFCVSIRTP
jgi:NADH:ubiquinone oxidoreductase subunit F (NADH-binding)